MSQPSNPGPSCTSRFLGMQAPSLPLPDSSPHPFFPVPSTEYSRALASQGCIKIYSPSTLSKSSKFSDRMIFQLPEKLGMVAALVAVSLDPPAGALDAESL